MRSIALLGLVVVRTATATRFLRGLAEHSLANVTTADYTRCVFQEVRPEVACHPENEKKRNLFGAKVRSMDEAFALCDADPKCDAVQRTPNRKEEQHAPETEGYHEKKKKGSFSLCALGKDACGRARLHKGPSHGYRVFTCLPYDERPAMRSGGLYALCLLMILAPVLLICICSCASSCGPVCHEPLTVRGSYTESEDICSESFSFCCPLIFFYVFMFLPFAFWSAYYGPARDHSTDGACDPRVTPWHTHRIAILLCGLIPTGILCGAALCGAKEAVCEAPRLEDHIYKLDAAAATGDVDAMPRFPDGDAMPLHVACQNGHVDAARLLLDNGAEVDRATENGRTPLYIACQNGRVDAVRQLLNKGAVVDRAKANGVTPLWIACQEGRVDAARLLLDKGAAVNRAREDGATPLFVACFKGHVRAARLLLEKGADVDRATENGQTPLFVACAEGHVDAARLLLERGADINRANNQGTTPLDVAKRLQRHAVVALLEERLYALLEERLYPLLVASKAGDVEAMTQLLDGGAAVDQANGDGTTSLWIACQNGRVDAARLLLDKGAEVNRADEGRRTPLYAACEHGHVGAVRLLLDKGAEVDRATKKGSTPLFAACFNGHVGAVRLVLDKGAVVDRATKTGSTPLGIAKYKGHSSIVALLKEFLPLPLAPPRLGQRQQSEDQCSICLKPYDDRAWTKCNHSFCRECITKVCRTNPPTNRAPCPFCRQPVLLGELTRQISVHEVSMARRKRYRAAIARRLEAVEREIAESRAQGESSETERRIAPPPAPARAASDTTSDFVIARALSRDADAALAASLQAEEAAAASLPRPPP